eukprot:gene5063-10136_t
MLVITKILTVMLSTSIVLSFWLHNTNIPASSRHHFNLFDSSNLNLDRTLERRRQQTTTFVWDSSLNDIIQDPIKVKDTQTMLEALKAIDRSCVHPSNALRWWNILRQKGAKPDKLSVISLLQQSWLRGKGDRAFLESLLTAVLASDLSDSCLDNSCINLLLQISFSVDSASFAKQVFQKATECAATTSNSNGHLLDAKAISIAINGFGKLGDMAAARKIFMSRDKYLNSSSSTDIVISNSFLNGLVKSGGQSSSSISTSSGSDDETWTFYRDLEASSRVDNYTVNIILDHCASTGDLDQARSIFATAESKGLADSISRALLVRCLIESGETEEAIASCRDYVTDPVVMSSLLYNLAKNGSPVDITVSLAKTIPHAILPKTLTSLLSGYLEAGRGHNVLRAYWSVYNLDDDFAQAMSRPVAVREIDLSGGVQVLNLVLAATGSILKQNTAAGTRTVFAAGAVGGIDEGDEVELFIQSETKESMWTYLKSIVLQRMKLAQEGSHTKAVDASTVSSALELANMMQDYRSADSIWDTALDIKSRVSPRIFHAYLRSLRDPSQLQRALALTRNMRSVLHRLDRRSCDEALNACLRTGGLAVALQEASILLRGSSSSDASVSDVSLRNVLIYFDRDCTLRTSSVLRSQSRSRSIQKESDALVKLLVRAKAGGTPVCVSAWGAVCGTLLSRGLGRQACSVLHTMQGLGSYTATEVSQAMIGAVVAALDESIPLATTSGLSTLCQIHRQLARGSSLRTALEQVPSANKLRKFGHRQASSMVDIVAFLETCIVAVAASPSVDVDVDVGKDRREISPGKGPDSRTTRLPVSVSLLQALFLDVTAASSDGVESSIQKDAAQCGSRLVRLLEGCRLLIDLDKSVYRDREGMQHVVTDVDAIRNLLARKWVAMLLRTSLKRLGTDITGSIRQIRAKKLLEELQQETDLTL